VRIEKKLRRLADTLISLASSHNYTEGLYDEVANTENLILAVPALRQLLISDEIGSEEKKRVLASVLEGRFSPILIAAVHYLIDTGKHKKILRFVHYLKHRLENEIRKEQATVITATEIEEDLKRSLAELAERKLGKRPKMRYEIDPEIIGGLILKIGDELIDASIKGRLLRFKKNVSAQL
jgi:F-type H+-transporting ATPase subunit delta